MIVGWVVTALCLGAGAPHPAPDALADSLARQIVAAHPDAPLAVSVSGPEADAVFTVLAAKLAQARLAPAALVCGTDCDAQALASGARTLVRVGVRASGEQWTADGELHGVWRNFWAGAREVRPPGPAATLHAEVSAPAPLPSAPDAGTPSSPTTAALVAQDLVTSSEPVEAIAAADLDGDGTDEVLVLTRTALQAYDGSGHLLAQRALDGLGFAQVASRDPLGTLAVQPSPLTIFAFSQVHASGERLSWDAARRSFTSTALLDTPMLGCSGESFPVSFTAGQNTLGPVRPPRPFSAVAQPSSALVCRLATDGGYLAAIAPDGTARLQTPAGSGTRAGLGAGVAWVDLDGDGKLELASSSAEVDPQPDRLTVTSAKGDLLVSLELPGRVLAITPARLSGHTGETLIVARAQPDGTTVLTRVQEVLR